MLLRLKDDLRVGDGYRVIHIETLRWHDVAVVI
jgi:hypothetical protein